MLLRIVMLYCDYLIVILLTYEFIFCFKQKTAYELRISDWSSDVCSSDLLKSSLRQGDILGRLGGNEFGIFARLKMAFPTRCKLSSASTEIGRASVGKECVSTCRSRWSPYH